MHVANKVSWHVVELWCLLLRMKLAPAPHLSLPGRSHQSALANLLFAACIASPLVGCGSDSAATDDSGKSTANLVLKSENNYKSESILTLPNIDTAAGEDLDISWPDLTKDLLCHSVSPQSDIKLIYLVRLGNKSQKDAPDLLLSGKLKQGSDGVALYREYKTDGNSTATKLSSMSPLNSTSKIVLADDYKEIGGDTYVLIASNTVSVGVGARAMVFLTPKAGNTNKTVAIPSGCKELEFKIDLQSLTKLSVPAKGPWIVDWKGITEDSEGNEIVWNNIAEPYELIVGYYDVGLKEIEDDSFNIDTRAAKLWRIKNITSGTRKDLKAAQASDGSLFTGFSEAKDKVWALGLYCPTCQNPAPMFFTILDIKD